MLQHHTEAFSCALRTDENWEGPLLTWDPALLLACPRTCTGLAAIYGPWPGPRETLVRSSESRSQFVVFFI